VDLVYLDPPFNSNANYNVLFAEKSGTRSAAQIQAFEDTWQWDESSSAAFREVVETGGEVAQALIAFRTFLGDSDMLAYLAMMAPRLVELRRVLKPTGSIYLHCDPGARKSVGVRIRPSAPRRETPPHSWGRFIFTNVFANVLGPIGSNGRTEPRGRGAAELALDSCRRLPERVVGLPHRLERIGYLGQGRRGPRPAVLERCARQIASGPIHEQETVMQFSGRPLC
jgi:hypothetical protein